MGLLLSHKRTTVTIFPDMVTFSVSRETSKGGGKRGEIEIMSRESRKRLLSLMHKLEFTSVTMVTLTYPADFPADGAKTKAHLKEFRRRFEKRFGKMRALWRLEFQKRGAPHYHILYFDCGFLPIPEVSALWHTIVKSRDLNHLLAGVDIKRIHEGSNRRIIMAYVSKYIAKEDKNNGNKSFEGFGRWWGRWNVEEPKGLQIDLSSGAALILAHKLGDFRRDGSTWRPTDYNSFAVFGNSMGSGEYCNYVQSVLADITKIGRG